MMYVLPTSTFVNRKLPALFVRIVRDCPSMSVNVTRAFANPGLVGVIIRPETTVPADVGPDKLVIPQSEKLETPVAVIVLVAVFSE